jgi:hypothetical protein
MMRGAIRLLAILISASFAAAYAQQLPETLPEEAAEEEVEPIRRYTVELIIFAYGETVSAGNEIWLPDEPSGEAVDEASPFFDFGDREDELTDIEAPPIGRRYMDLELVLFGEDDYTMKAIYDKLVELDAYEPILRAGWTQPTYAKEVTASIPLDTLAQSPPWLDGELTLYLGRYLHLVVDLTMDDDRSANPEEAQNAAPGVLTFGDARNQNEFGEIDAYGRLLAPTVHYRIFEDRIVKNGDIRYFDHPKFGVIAKITRFEEPDEEEEFFDDTEDLLPAS